MTTTHQEAVDALERYQAMLDGYAVYLRSTTQPRTSEDFRDLSVRQFELQSAWQEHVEKTRMLMVRRD